MRFTPSIQAAGRRTYQLTLNSFPCAINAPYSTGYQISYADGSLTVASWSNYIGLYPIAGGFAYY